MTKPDGPDRDRRDELLNFLTVAGTLAGLSVTAVTLMKTLGSSSVATTIVDEIGLRTVDGHRMMIGQELGA